MYILMKAAQLQDEWLHKNVCQINASMSSWTILKRCLYMKIYRPGMLLSTIKDQIMCRYMREISNRLSIDLDANTAAEFVFDESYWKRRCLQKYPQCNSKISEHGLMWKQLFFETHIQQVHSLVALSGNLIYANSVWRSLNLIQM